MALSRRGFVLGLAAGIAAPAIVKASSLMPVRNRLVEADFYLGEWAGVKFIYSKELAAELIAATQPPCRFRAELEHERNWSWFSAQLEDEKRWRSLV